MATSTPWGVSQSSHKFTRGINFYSTSSHGGIKVSPKLNERIHEAWRNKNGWYEEDCEVAKVIYTFPQFFPNTVHETLCMDLERYYPDTYAKIKEAEIK